MKAYPVLVLRTLSKENCSWFVQLVSGFKTVHFRSLQVLVCNLRKHCYVREQQLVILRIIYITCVYAYGIRIFCYFGPDLSALHLKLEMLKLEQVDSLRV